MDKHRRGLRLRQSLVVPWIVVVMVGAAVSTAELAESDLEAFRDERGGLVALRDGLRSAKDLHSNWTGPPCHGGRSRWYGVSCDGDGRVVGVRLDGVQLTGALPAGALRGVARLATLSLRDNAIHGALPGLAGLDRLRVIDLSSNRFSGPIPRRYAVELPALTRLELQDNLLNGTVPSFAQGELTVFNVSYNFLQGEVPDTRALRRFPASAFGHNLKLCGEAVNAACGSGSPSADDGDRSASSRDDRVVRPADHDARGRAARKSRHFKLTAWSVVAIALIAAMVPFAAVLIFLHQTKKSQEVRLGGRATPTGAPDIKDKAEQGKLSGSGSGSSSGSRNAQAQLQCFRADKAAGFDLDDLFRSTAEMLGKGRLGITYRVTLEAGTAVVVVKRLRNMGHVPRKDFAHTMQLLGKLRHENVVEVVACYHSKEEKLAVYEHVPGRSLFELLHGTEQRRGQNAAAVAGEAVDSEGHGARAGVPAPVGAVFPPAAARQPQVVQRDHPVDAQRQAPASARGAEAHGLRLPPAAPAPRAQAGRGQVPGVRPRQATVVPSRRVLLRPRAAGGGDGEVAGGRGRRRHGGVGASGAEPRVVHGHTRRGDRRRAGTARGHAEAHGGRADVRCCRARQAAQDARRRQDDRRDRRRRGREREVGARRRMILSCM
uniref:Protein kinase domain-containing protein n=1 Tax=Aegilops tauschii subsp. strangulata TaxID=200361 RepID=A0A452YLG8_AEGTS